MGERLFFRPPADLNWDDDAAVEAWATALWAVFVVQSGTAPAVSDE
jgi:hypothetical protein